MSDRLPEQKRFVVRTEGRSLLRTEVRTTNLTYCGQSIGYYIKGLDAVFWQKQRFFIKECVQD